jgi:hypothetical protein
MWVFGVAIGVVTALLAWRKGYNPMLWFLAAGVIGLLILAFLPFANEANLPSGARDTLKKRGDMIGGVISAVVVLYVLIDLLK